MFNWLDKLTGKSQQQNLKEEQARKQKEKYVQSVCSGLDNNPYAIAWHFKEQRIAKQLTYEEMVDLLTFLPQDIYEEIRDILIEEDV